MSKPARKLEMQLDNLRLVLPRQIRVQRHCHSYLTLSLLVRFALGLDHIREFLHRPVLAMLEQLEVLGCTWQSRILPDLPRLGRGGRIALVAAQFTRSRLDHDA